MNINVGAAARAKFFDPPTAAREFWDFSFVPPCKDGDRLIFRFDGIAVAKAIVEHVEGGEDEWGRARYKVFWLTATFEDLRTRPAAERPPATAKPTPFRGGLFGASGGRAL